MLTSARNGLKGNISHAISGVDLPYTIQNLCLYKRSLMIQPQYSALVKELHSVPIPQITLVQHS